ncbi:peptidoglycan editing factor PgeF [Solimonas marina]|uniref:Purine nucleoside phosphorylase n=1 Tax=Solimonas marina TaxID=2714601 RepID=A0A970B8H8_9GAMM|nr:peptidoglycan editing factor PgeF [Solimonas marina]NKF21396.1 peptidoglycan editing factor PgeF [Solimonas marina]
MIELLHADWPAPPGIHAVQTTRSGGLSLGDCGTLNLGSNTPDDPARVAANRQRLRETLALPVEPAWLRQVHGTRVVDAGQVGAPPPDADASVSQQPGIVCAVLTADCLPVLLCSDDGRWIGAAHAGWRGLSAGVLEATVARAPQAPERLMAWLGAAIGPAHFEVGPEVRAAFVDDRATAASAFTPGRGDRWHADLYALARLRLADVGVTRVHGGGRCTYADAQRFYSYRREPAGGRMAALIWRDTEAASC